LDSPCLHCLGIRCWRRCRGRFFKNFRSVMTQSELCHNSKDDLFTVVKRLWRSSDWPQNFKEPASGAFKTGLPDFPRYNTPKRGKIY
jgi:hypothetical protein